MQQTYPKLLRVLLPVILLLTIASTVFSNTYIVNSTADAPATAAGDGTGNSTLGIGIITLRSAIQTATALGGSHTITFNLSLPNTITLTSAIVVGVANSNITIMGPGQNLSIVQTGNSRIFTTGAGAITFILEDLRLTYNGPAVPYSGGGGAISAGDVGAVTTISNCIFEGFRYQVGNGGVISASANGPHTLTVTNCIFNNNKTGGAGGAINFLTVGGTATINRCTFSGNSTGIVGLNTGGDGGALNLSGTAPGGTYTVTECLFSGNLTENATAHGGAINVVQGDLVANYNRFSGNSTVGPANGKSIWLAGGDLGNTVNADNNWWGVNDGPAAGDIANGPAPVTPPVATKWIQLKATPSTTPICPTNVLLGNTSTVTASLLSNSANEAIAASNLDAFIGQQVNYTAVLGTLSAASGTLVNGTTNVTFTSNGSPGNATVNATFDNIPTSDPVARATIVVNAPASITTQPLASTICEGTAANFTVVAAGTATIVYQWRKGTTNLVNGATGTGSTIAGATTANLIITNTSAADEATDYNVVISNSCASQVTSNNVSLSVWTPPIVSSPTVTQPNCNQPKGTIVVNATGVSTLAYSIDGGANYQASNTFTMVDPGNYFISVHYELLNTCAAAYQGNPIIITEPSAAVNFSTPTITQPTCALTTGTIVVNASIAAGTLEYKLNVDGTWGSSNSFDELAPGGYNIFVREASNPDCVFEYDGNPVTINSVPSPPSIQAPTITQPNCDITTGTIVINATGSGALQYQLNEGEWSSSTSFGGLAPGDYSISVRLLADNSCSSIYGDNPVTIDPVPVAPTVVAVDVTQPTCETPTGIIVIDATGAGTLEYSIGGLFQESATFEGLAPGGYPVSVRLKDNITCVTIYGSVNVSPTGIRPDITSVIPTQPSCETPTGSLTVNVSSDGPALFLYRVNGGAWQESNVFNDLPPGDYTVQVTLSVDETCISTYSFNPVTLETPTGCTVPASIECPANITAVAPLNSCSALVTFAAIASGTPAPTVVYKIGNTVITSPHNFPVGETTVTAIATNSTGTDECTFTVTVEDNQAPVINVVGPVFLWSPDHKYQRINVNNLVTSIADNCGPVNINNVVISYVTSDEADDAPGGLDGSTINDIRIATNCKSVELRRERYEGRNGRVYNIHLSYEDGSGNIGTAFVKVHVPASKKNVPAGEDAVVYTVYSNCSNLITSANTSRPPMESIAESRVSLQAWPNPVVHSTTIRYSIPVDAQVSLEVYNGMGQKLAQLANGLQKSGSYQVSYDASKLSAGIYIYRLQTVDKYGRQEVLNGKLVVGR
ncbi:T9SS type A sorting domain-containing protein [Flavihumibacter sp.]|uniref:T9SS type A sorting domain-containing protein n=1 Tax=Flavihumibacter sp. TaxID=1913981 RepID=UPI002FCA1A14